MHCVAAPKFRIMGASKSWRFNRTMFDGDTTFLVIPRPFIAPMS